MRIGWLVGLLVWWVWLDIGAIAVWRTEATLWAHAYTVSPCAFRVASNHAKHLYVDGREADVLAVLTCRP